MDLQHYKRIRRNRNKVLTYQAIYPKWKNKSHFPKKKLNLPKIEIIEYMYYDLIDSPYRKAPAGFKTSAFLSVESFLVRNLGLSLVDIILAVKKSEC